MNIKCWFCGGDVIWDISHQANDVYEEIESDEAMLHYAHCSVCESEYEMIEYPKDYKQRVLGIINENIKSNG